MLGSGPWKLLGAAMLLGAAGYAATQLSPWPSAIALRLAMNYAGRAMNSALEPHVPPGIEAMLDVRYNASDADALLDLFYPSGTAGSGRRLPTIVWVHGGAWISGDKDQVRNYLKILAGKGYTTIAVNYSLAPAIGYPTPIWQVNAALAHIRANASRYGVDTSQMFLGGDSAGAQIAGQIANLITSPKYAEALGISPAVDKADLKGAILFCGPYDGTYGGGGAFSVLVDVALWSYFGKRNPDGDPRLTQFSVIGNATASLPPLFISAGSADPLEPHSKRLADTAARLGVPVDALFFSDSEDEALPHEYQFNLDTKSGGVALDRVSAFLKANAK